MKIDIDPAITPEQRLDPRFKKLLREWEEFFNSPDNDPYKLLIGLHEASHIYYARRIGATNIVRYGPKIVWNRKHNRPVIWKSSVSWVPNGSSAMDNLKASVAGYVVRMELSGQPNDERAIEADLEECRPWFRDEDFNAAVLQVEAEIVKDLRSPAVRHEIWAEARLFVKEVFQQTPGPTVRHLAMGLPPRPLIEAMPR